MSKIKQRNKSLNTDNNIAKKDITVAIMGEEDEVGGTKFVYDMWRAVKPKLVERGFTIKEIILDEPKYDDEVVNISKGKYDLLVGYFSVLSRRAKLANYTKPLILDQQIIVFEPTHTWRDTEIYKLLSVVSPVLFIFLFFGSVFSLILYFWGDHFGGKGKHKMHWHFWGVFGALLGEPGTIVERVGINNTINIIIAFTILLFVFFFSLILEAAFTTKIHAESIAAEKDPIGTNIKGQKFLVSKGTSMVDTVKRAGGISVLDDADYTKLQDTYFKRKSEVRGFITDLSTWGSIKDKKEYKTLKRSDYQFPYDEVAWLVNKNEHKLLEVMEDILINLREKNIIRDLCTKNMPYMKHENCTL